MRGWKNVHVTDGDHPYMKRWWVPGLQIGYEHTFTHQFADFLEALGNGTAAEPTFRSGLATDLVTDAVLRSAQSRQWETCTLDNEKSTAARSDPLSSIIARFRFHVSALRSIVALFVRFVLDGPDSTAQSTTSASQIAAVRYVWFYCYMVILHYGQTDVLAR